MISSPYSSNGNTQYRLIAILLHRYHHCLHVFVRKSLLKLKLLRKLISSYDFIFLVIGDRIFLSLAKIEIFLQDKNIQLGFFLYLLTF